MTENLIALYGGAVPRYTSYPTAPHFHAGVGADAYGEWLAALAPGSALSLYVHVPFCRAMCWFCGCHTRGTRRDGPVLDYLPLLLAELETVSARLPGRMAVTHIHFGGGTPHLAGGRVVAAVIDALGRWQDISGEAEIAVEVDPRVFDRDTAATLAAAGVNRASLGVQDFDRRVQQAIGRSQPYERSAAAVETLRACGVDRINLDLMYGLPLQTTGGIVRSVEMADALGPDRIALFGYAHVPWMKRNQRLIDEALLPGGAERFAQQAAAACRLAGLGYRAIGLDHFARPEDGLARASTDGRLRRNFQGYTTDAAPALVGLGVSAIGALPQGYVQNTADSRTYARAVSAGGLATARGLALTAEDRVRREVIERLMCDGRVDLARWPCRFDAERARLAGMAQDGIVALEGRRVAVTEAGRPFLRAVAAVFDAYLGGGAARHSRAV